MVLKHLTKLCYWLPIQAQMTEQCFLHASLQTSSFSPDDVGGDLSETLTVLQTRPSRCPYALSKVNSSGALKNKRLMKLS